jgi:hypothetical protein
MDRREFLSAGIVMTGGLMAKRLTFFPPSTRAAIVIGVDKAGDLPKLRAAASGALAMGEWLSSEGFDVTTLTDANGPVRFADLFDAVKRNVDNAALTQLVIYFAGHGFVNGYSEHWMLSGAPDNQNEAVSLNESVFNARLTGISNVVFISDACRSKADSIRIQRVSGSVLFPNPVNQPAVPADVDQFLATLVGDASWEVPVAESSGAFEGIYTRCFLEAFKHPDVAMVKKTATGQSVVPNNTLKPYLAREVPIRAQAASITLKQRPDSLVVSPDTTFIGRALGDPATSAAIGAGRAGGPPRLAPVPVTVRDVANAALRDAGATIIAAARPGVTSAMISTESKSSGYADANDRLIQSRGLPAELSVRTGATISGARVASATVRPGFKAEHLNGIGSQLQASVEVTMARGPATSLAIRFENGTGTVIAALEGYIASVVVDENGVSSVSYLPSRQNPLRGEFDHEGAKLVQLRDAVATAARFGVFRFEGPREQRQAAAAQMADRIRVLKGIDPTLGLYAAYAYADAGLPSHVGSVRGFMRDTLGADLFDVVMLSGDLSSRAVRGPERLAPFCPMLTQGWSLLRVLNVRLPESLADLRIHLRHSLWTTFDAEGMTIVESALRDGRID